MSIEKSLYGFKPAPRQWYKRFDSFMIGQGYTHNQYDNCVYFQHSSGGSFVYLLLYVDDMLIVFKDKSLINKLKSQLNDDFEMKDLRATKKILGMEIQRDQKADKLTRLKETTLRKFLINSTWVIANLCLLPLL